jgi:ribonuclease VapC
VEPLLDEGIVCAANWSEILQKVRHRGLNPDSTADLLVGLGLRVEPVSEPDARKAAEIWSDRSDLSLADRLCLATAERLGHAAITADGSWHGATVNIELRLIR